MADIQDRARRGQVDTDAAEVYEEFFVPALFGQWATALLDAGAVEPGDRVLDVGCGTGVVARAARARVGEAGSVTGVDVNEGMLAVAAERAPDVEWRMAEAEDLPFADDTFDVATCSFALMFVADPTAAVSEMRRVVAPGGRIAMTTWSDVRRSPGYARMVELLDEMFGEEAADALRAPFSLGSEERLRAVVEPALPELAVVEREGLARFESVDSWVLTDVRGWTLSGMVDDDDLVRLQAAARERLTDLTDGSGRVSFPAPALLATATST